MIATKGLSFYCADEEYRDPDAREELVEKVRRQHGVPQAASVEWVCSVSAGYDADPLWVCLMEWDS